MATQWYFQTGAVEGGPVAFRELIELVRSGTLTETDRVRSSWKSEWQPAASVVGLFYMASRSPEEMSRLNATSEPAAATIAAEPNNEDAEKDAAKSADDRPGWMKRLLEIGDTHEPTPAGLPIPGRPHTEPPAEVDARPAVRPGIRKVEASASVATKTLAPEFEVYAAAPVAGAGSAWSNAVDSALISVDARQSGTSEKTSPSGVGRLFSRIGQMICRSDAAKARLRIGFRVVCAIVCAALVANAIENWSRQQDLRFPDRKPPPGYKAIGRYYFPVVGRCKRRNYLYLISGLTLAIAAGAWFAAGWVESRTD